MILGLAFQSILVLLFLFEYRFDSLVFSKSAALSLIFSWIIFLWSPKDRHRYAILSFALILFAVFKPLDALGMILGWFLLSYLMASRAPWAAKLLVLIALPLLTAGLPGQNLALIALSGVFVFRGWLYLKETQEDPSLRNPLKTLSFFGLPQNYTVPTFVLLSFKEFSQIEEDRNTSMEKASRWLFNGILHFAVYKYTREFFPLKPTDVQTGGEAAQFFLAAFLVYLRVSGKFYIALGTLSLFGFRLPEMHNKFFFAKNFLEAWNRINIPWRDYMSKMLLFPVYMQLKRLRHVTALLIAFGSVFFASWFMHGFYFLWVAKHFMIDPAEVIFWSTNGCLVLLNIVWVSRWPGRKTEDHPVMLGLKIAGVFATGCFLRSFWLASRPSEVFDIFSRVTWGDSSDFLWFLAFPIVGIAGIFWPKNSMNPWSRSALLMGLYGYMVYG